MTKLDIALALATEGFAVFPLAAGAKAPPLVPNWPARATTDPATIQQLWLAVPDANIGIHCRGLVVIDVDVAKGGQQSLGILNALNPLPLTYRVRTPTGGSHMYYRLPAGHPGVSNSVGKLGAGLDTRSTNGYVVGPGSDVPAGRYYVDRQGYIAEAPDWLLRLLGEARAKESTKPVADAPDDTFARAADWLARHEGAIEGTGGDAHTYATACKLRDLGVSEPQCVELLTGEWNSRCAPPWDPADLRIKAHNAFRYAQEVGGGKLAVSAVDFPVAPAASPVALPDKPAKRRLMRADELASSKATGAGYLVKGMLERGTYAEIYGAPGEGKTFVALDLSYHVAAGREWFGHKVHAGPVLYLAYEGTGGMRKRVQALLKHYKGTDVPLYVDAADYNLRELAGRQALGRTIAEMPEKPVLIVIDTFARALMGGDENSAQDVGAFNTAVGALIEGTGACVLIIHHTGKDKSKGARGSSALVAAIDTEIEIDDHQITATKQRDIEMGEPHGFTLAPVGLSIDIDGDIVTSCVVQPLAGDVPEKRERISGHARRGFEALCQLAPDNKPVYVDGWKDACGEFLGTRDLRKRFYDIKQALVDKGYVIVDNKGMVTRRLE